ncbi:allatostatin-A receptor-like [Dendronephthya gigantea]|uniref:allatostatin-A receptor-like n=1 Tax=Dendronephthya gigantea TaxID=151771 RepID=UPI00106A26EC|nr:allatostatin-A receptor-like [Dendronephthya gigantea]
MVYGKVVLTAISIIAFLGNSLTVLLFIKKSELLKKTYNCLILALAVQDILQAIFIAILPGYILDEDAYTLPPDRTLRWMFCKLFWSQFFIFALGIASVYTCLMLTFDRWLAVVMPLTFKKYEKSKLVVFSTVLFPWIAGTCFEITAPLRATTTQVNGSFSCAWKTPEYSSKTIVIATFTFLGMIVVPGALMVIAYSRIIVHMKRSEIRIEVIRNNQRMVRKSNALKALKRVTTTAFFASGIIIVCWLPDQLYYALSQVNLTELGTTIHFVFKSLAFANSCINPAIYCFSNRAYRTGLRELFGCFCCKVHPQGGELSGPGEAVHPS